MVDRGTLYTAFWTVGIFLAAGVSARLMRARGMQWTSLLMAAALSMAAFTYGAKVQHRLFYSSLSDAFFPPFEAFLSAGHSIPLGLLLGVVLPAALVALIGDSWRIAGDSLAIGFTLTSSVGRIGCLVAGCCTGIRCDSWFCVPFPPGSQAYQWQVREGWIEPGRILSLPVHPLPVYFLLFSLGLAFVLWRISRSRLPEGTALAAWAVAQPLGRLWLESLRGGMPARSTTLAQTLEVWLVADIAIAVAMVASYAAVRYRRGPAAESTPRQA